MASVGDDDDVPQLSAHALAALAEFQTERDTRTKQFEELKTAAETEFGSNEGSTKPLTMEAFTEDWNASQFWYNDETATALAKELLKGASDESKIVVVSAPSVFIQLKNLLASPEYQIRPEVKLLEFDKRFEVFKEFVPYDFMHPTRLPLDLKGKFDRIICDPPFLSVDCQTKAAMTVRWLSRSWNAESIRLIVCTGERMEYMVGKLYGKTGIRTTNYEVQHAKGLSNEFRCYANFESESWNWRADDAVKETQQNSVVREED